MDNSTCFDPWIAHVKRSIHTWIFGREPGVYHVDPPGILFTLRSFGGAKQDRWENWKADLPDMPQALIYDRNPAGQWLLAYSSSYPYLDVLAPAVLAQVIKDNPQGVRGWEHRSWFAVEMDQSWWDALESRRKAWADQFMCTI